MDTRDFRDSSLSRTHYGAANRPHSFIGGQFPLSDNSPFIGDDLLTSTLFAKKEKERQSKENSKRQHLINQKKVQLRELSRRICERETVENYIQTPYSVSKGSEMEFGINVYDDRITDLRKHYTKAEKFGAVEAIGKLETSMRQNCLRVTDLFALVDHDRSGTIDREELQTALKAYKVNLDEVHFAALFRYLDSSGDGKINETELEGAIREHRRFNHSKKMIESHERKMEKRSQQSSSSSSSSPSSHSMIKDDDERMSSSYRRLLSSKQSINTSSNTSHGGGSNWASSVPMIGQLLILSQASIHQSQQPTNVAPMTVWEQQASKAMKASEADQSRQQAKMHQHRESRRADMINKLHERQAARRSLEDGIKAYQCFK